MRAAPLMIGLGLCALLAHSAAAQGRGNAFGHAKGSASAGAAASASSPGSPSAADGGAGPAPDTGVRNFGAWLDDASVLAPGGGLLIAQACVPTQVPTKRAAGTGAVGTCA